MASSSSSPYPSSPTPQTGTYDVFLSFRGKDTRNTFIGHLYNNLVQKGIKTFKDDDEIQGGQEIESTLLKAIEESKIFIVVFSENYATSKWCLDELVKVMECKKLNHRIVYPVFYKVEPSDVRYQKGSFAEAFSKHKLRYNLQKIDEWKTALTQAVSALKQAADLSGRQFSEGGHEADFVNKIVGEISKNLIELTYLKVAENPIALESCVVKMLNLLCVEKSDVRMIGLWGIGGIGKTTIAKAVYNKIAHNFDGRCFLKNVKDHGGVVQVQELLLSKMLGYGTLKLTSDDEGAEIIKKRLRQKKVLIVVDDVNEISQLKNLVGEPNWFGSGSRIIITTRDKQLLIHHKVNEIYEVEKLNYKDALELLCLNAFEENRTLDQDTKAIIKDVLHYSNGLPLALVVIGSLLRNRSRDTWQAALRSHRKSGKGIHEFLKISYDALANDEKEIFLHIAFFFKGKNMNYVMDILEGCDLNPKDGIEVLRKMALINITGNDNIWMHGVLQDMGKNIVIQDSQNGIGGRSRLWAYDEVRHVIEGKTGTHNVKGIIFEKALARIGCNYTKEEQIRLSSASFLNMTNLQILKISCYGNIFNGDDHLNYLSSELRLLEWGGCPLQCFPSEFYPRNLTVLKLHFGFSKPGRLPEFLLEMLRSCRSPHGKKLQTMKNLKYIDLKYCHGVTNIFDFSVFPNLVDLKVTSEYLVEADQSVGYFTNLVNLDFAGCKKLRKFEIVQEMKSLKHLNIFSIGIKEFTSFSISYLMNLETLRLRHCHELKKVSFSIFEWQHLRHVEISLCLKLVTFQAMSEIFPSNSTSLQDKHYDPLFVNLFGCSSLVEIPAFPRELNGLRAERCYALERVSMLSNILEGKESKMIPWMDLSFCSKLCRNLARDVAEMRKNLPDDSEVTALLSLFLSCRQSQFEVRFPGSELPEWFTYKYTTCRPESVDCNFTIEFPVNFKWENKGLAICAHTETDSRFCGIYINGVCFVPDSIRDPGLFPGHGNKFREHGDMFGGHVRLYYIPLHTITTRLSVTGLPPPSSFQVKFRFERMSYEPSGMRSCGVHIVMPENEGDEGHPQKPSNLRRRKGWKAAGY